MLAASTTRLPPKRARQSRPRAIISAGTDTSNFMFPATSTLARPSSRIRRASASVCATTQHKVSSAGRISERQRSPLRSDFCDSRALTSASGTRCATAAAHRFGQSSVSITMPSAGRQARRKRLVA